MHINKALSISILLSCWMLVCLSVSLLDLLWWTMTLELVFPPIDDHRIVSDLPNAPLLMHADRPPFVTYNLNSFTVAGQANPSNIITELDFIANTRSSAIHLQRYFIHFPPRSVSTIIHLRSLLRSKIIATKWILKLMQFSLVLWRWSKIRRMKVKGRLKP